MTDKDILLLFVYIGIVELLMDENFILNRVSFLCLIGVLSIMDIFFHFYDIVIIVFLLIFLLFSLFKFMLYIEV